MDATRGPMNVLWVRVPTASTANNLASAIAKYPPGVDGRYYLFHMALCEGRAEDVIRVWTRQGYHVEVASSLRRYTLGTQQVYFVVFWVAKDGAPKHTTNPVLHLVPDNSGITPDHFMAEPACADVPPEEYWQQER